MKKFILFFALVFFTASAFSQTSRIPYSYLVDTFAVHIYPRDTVIVGSDTTINPADTSVLIGAKAQGIIPLQSYVVYSDGTFGNNNSVVTFTPDTVCYNKIVDCINLQNSYEGGNSIYPALHYSSDMAIHGYSGTVKGVKLKVKKVGSTVPVFYVLIGVK